MRKRPEASVGRVLLENECAPKALVVHVGGIEQIRRALACAGMGRGLVLGLAGLTRFRSDADQDVACAGGCDEGVRVLRQQKALVDKLPPGAPDGSDESAVIPVPFL